MCWKTAQTFLLALLCVLCSQHRAEAAYSPAVVRIDTGSADGAFTDTGDNVWAADSNSNAGIRPSTPVKRVNSPTEIHRAFTYLPPLGYHSEQPAQATGESPDYNR